MLLFQLQEKIGKGEFGDVRLGKSSHIYQYTGTDTPYHIYDPVIIDLIVLTFAIVSVSLRLHSS
jgi:hypothetical protein